MRNPEDKTFVGAGTLWAFREMEDKELYRNHATVVDLPYDRMDTKERKNLNGPVKTYHISESERDKDEKRKRS